MKKLFLLFLLVSFSLLTVNAQKDDFETWLELEFTKQFLKDFEFSLVPEIRFENNYAVNEYMLEGELAYEAFKFLDFSAGYRFNTEVKNDGENEKSSRLTFDVTGKRDFDRLEVSLRGRITNYTQSDDEDDADVYFRPRLKFEYNIKGNKITPFASYELFRNLNENEFDKQRFDFGATREFAKIHRIGLYYRLQDYLYDKNTVHIVGIEYRLKI